MATGPQMSLGGTTGDLVSNKAVAADCCLFGDRW